MKKLESRTVRELIALAREWGVSGYSKLKKSELVQLLSKSLPRKAVQDPPKDKKPAKTTGRGAKGPSEPAKKKVDPPKASAAKASAAKASAAKASAAKASAAKASATRAKTASKTTEGARKAASSSRRARAAASKARLPGPRTEAARGPVGTEPARETRGPAAAIPETRPATVPGGRMGLLARDPHWLYCFWELDDHQRQILWNTGAPVLRVVRLDGQTEHEVHRIALPPEASSWYVNVREGDRVYRCDLGVDLPGNGFEGLLSSNTSSTPPDFADATADAEAPLRVATYRAPALDSQTPRPAGVPATTGQAAGLGGDFDYFRAQSMAAQPPAPDSASMLAERDAMGRGDSNPASESLFSPGFSWFGGAPSSPVAAVGGQGSRVTGPGQDYWLVVDADLIIYGATVPGSRVHLADLEVPVDESGHFGGRFALSDGAFEYPVEGLSPDGGSTRRFRLKVQRETEG